MAVDYTPGPWTLRGPSLSRDPSQLGDYAIVADGLIIAETFHRVASNKLAPAYSNARLICAAPDLVRAAKNAYWGWRKGNNIIGPMVALANLLDNLGVLEESEDTNG